MIALKRILQIFVLATCFLGSTGVFAEEAAVSQGGAALSGPQEPAEAPAPQEGKELGEAWLPEPTTRSCTATSQCTPVGGTPVTCTGVFTCSSAANWVTCDGVNTYCTCNPEGVPDCADPVGFCNCWSQSPGSSWGSCRQGYCFSD